MYQMPALASSVITLGRFVESELLETLRTGSKAIARYFLILKHNDLKNL